MIRISVVLPAYDRQHVLEQELPRVFAQDFPPREVEAKVVRYETTEGAGSTASRKTLESESGLRCPAILYHHVGPLLPGTYPDLTVSPKQFEQQIRWLASKGYVGILPSDWIRCRREGASLPEKAILLTFDDAYDDTAQYALPILRRYGFGAVVFVVTGQLGGTNTWDEADGRGTLQLMTAEQIKYWAAQGIEFGAHSRTHPDLTRQSAEECAAEVAGSKSDLSALLGSPIASFAYPYGACNEAVCDVVRREFDLAFSVEEGMNSLRTDPHLLRRTYIGPGDSLMEFALIVRWGGLNNLRNRYRRFGIRTWLRRAMKSAIDFPGKMMGRKDIDKLPPQGRDNSA